MNEDMQSVYHTVAPAAVAHSASFLCISLPPLCRQAMYADSYAKLIAGLQ